MRTAHEFAAIAESFANVRWRRYGRDPRKGLDCGGLIIAALQRVGIIAPDARDYDAGMPAPDLVWRRCREVADDAPWEDQGEGRLGICAWESGAAARHLVVMLAGRRIVHVDAGFGRVTVVPASWMASKLAGVFRVRGLEYAQPW